MRQFHVYFIIASIEGRNHLLIKLINSIRKSFCMVDFEIIVVYQYKEKKINIDCDKLFMTRDYGVSKARNIGINHVLDKAKDNDYICFPDDDSYYNDTAGFFCVESFNKSREIVFGDVRDEKDERRIGSHVISKDKLLYNYTAINCLSFFINVSCGKYLRFSEKFGPGGKYPAAEETEYLYQMIKRNINAKAYYDPRIKIHHPYDITSSKKTRDYSYAQGALLKHIMNDKSPAVFAYLLMVFRPVVGMITNLHDKKKYIHYKTRIKGLVEGFTSK